MNKFIHVALTEDAYRSQESLRDAIAALQEAGNFETLDGRYARQLGTLQGSLPDENVSAVRALPIVHALTEEEIWNIKT